MARGRPKRDAAATVPVADLPPPLGRRIAGMAADALGRLTDEEIPLAWRRIARFAPGPRSQRANPALLNALEDDPSFRQRLATQVRERYAWSAQVDEGRVPDGVPAGDAAAAAWLLRPDGWSDTVLAAIQDTGVGGGAPGAGRPAQDGRHDRRARTTPVADPPGRIDDAALRQELAAARADADAAATRARAEADQLRRELGDARRELRAETRRLEHAEATAAEQAASAARQHGTDERRLSDANAEIRRLKSRLRDAEADLVQARKAARDDRSVADVRVRLLLDAVVGAAQGLRQEMALPPVAVRPADDVVSAGGAVVPGTTVLRDRDSRALEDDDPVVLDALLALPQVHLVVDGYNVTKLGYGGLTLEQQRDRLVRGLIGVAVRTRAEVTVVFDGAAVDARVGTTQRNVRVLFSPPGESADEVIRRLVRVEPPGRPVVVVSSDREVADGVTDSGARSMPSRTLLALLGRA